MSLAAQQSLESHYVMHTFGRSPVEFVEGHGMKLTGDDGREYLDFLAGIGVCSLGHGDPAVLSALEAQTKKLMHVSNYFYIEQRGQVAALLSKLANDDVDGARVLADAVVAEHGGPSLLERCGHVFEQWFRHGRVCVRDASKREHCCPGHVWGFFLIQAHCEVFIVKKRTDTEP